MTIPVLQADVELAIERTLTGPEVEKLPARVQKASDLVEGYLGQVYADDATIPGVVTRVAAGAVGRLYQRDTTAGVPPLFANSQQSALGPFNANITFNQDVTSGDPWLTKADKMRLVNVFSGFRAIGVQSDRECLPPS